MYEQTGKLPDALKKRPEVPHYLMGYLAAFKALHKRRQVGFSMEQPLQVSEIILYGLTHTFEAELPFFFKVITALDDVFISSQTEKAKKKTAEMKGKKSPPPRPSRRPPRR